MATKQLSRNEALKLAAACKGTEHGYVAGAYTKLTVGKAAAFGLHVASLALRGGVASASYAGAFAKNTVVGYAKTR